MAIKTYNCVTTKFLSALMFYGSVILIGYNGSLIAKTDLEVVHYPWLLTPINVHESVEASNTSQELDASRFSSLISTPEGFILAFGWEDPEKNGYDASGLTDEQKLLFFQKGLKTITDKFETEEPNEISCVLAEQLVRYYSMKKNNKKSLFWAFKGAEKGSSFCMRILSDAFRQGTGVVQDLEEGCKWIYLSAAAGDELCKQWLKENHKCLFYKKTAPILKEAKRRANQWMKEHSDLFISAD